MSDETPTSGRVIGTDDDDAPERVGLPGLPAGTAWYEGPLRVRPVSLNMHGYVLCAQTLPPPVPSRTESRLSVLRGSGAPVLEPAAQEFADATANPPYLFDLSIEDGRKTGAAMCSRCMAGV